jgi:hypothetical protein
VHQHLVAAVRKPTRVHHLHVRLGQGLGCVIPESPQEALASQHVRVPVRIIRPHLRERWTVRWEPASNGMVGMEAEYGGATVERGMRRRRGDEDG